MSLNDTVSAERVHIGFFGRRNAGKSSLVNAVTGQALSVVSDVRGTTTDPVQKAMELLPVGPVVILDTPGLDDEGELGLLRVEKARQALRKTDVAVLVVDAVLGLQPEDEAFLRQLEAEKKPYLTVFNKADLVASVPENGLAVSASTGQGVHELKEALAALARPLTQQERLLVCDLLRPGLPVVLVTPIDKAAPKGRLILPQQQTLRELLDHGIPAFVCRETELEATLALLSAPPQLVITDSQAFRLVAKLVPESVPLTSFSILFARYKGDLELLVHGADALKRLRDGDTVLISEGCTHHRQCGDIGTEKLPCWLRAYTGKKLRFRFTSGGEFPDDPTGFALVIHCGGCMLNAQEMRARLSACRAHGVPVTNYGTAIAQMNGILPRALAPIK